MVLVMNANVEVPLSAEPSAALTVSCDGSKRKWNVAVFSRTILTRVWSEYVYESFFKF